MARLVVMGPSGSGKTTLAGALAQSLAWDFIEGDDLHPAANREKMRAGIALDDRDREPWLDAVGHALRSPGAPGVVASCSALKRRYRDVLREAVPGLRFVLPVLPREVLASRLAGRTGHYMPAALLASQLATLEPPSPAEEVLCLDGTLPLARQVQQVIAWLAAAGVPGDH